MTELDAKGRCCGRKPLRYKRSHGPGHPAQYFCVRCNRAYDLDTGTQIANWAWRLVDGEFRGTTNLNRGQS